MKLRAITVNYFNTLPLRSGLAKLCEQGKLELDMARPAQAARLYLAGNYDLGLLPIATLFAIPEGRVVSNYGILSKGFVGSVGIFSELPLEECKTLWLDYDSRSSALLSAVLLKHHWKRDFSEGSKDLQLSLAPAGYRDSIVGQHAGLIIGDPAIQARSKYRYYYDLGEAWYAMTGLPFVFAAWLSDKFLPEGSLDSFDAAQAEGLSRRAELAKSHQAAMPGYDLYRYFTQQIIYPIDDAARRGLANFLELGQDVLPLMPGAYLKGLPELSNSERRF